MCPACITVALLYGLVTLAARRAILPARWRSRRGDESGPAREWRLVNR